MTKFLICKKCEDCTIIDNLELRSASGGKLTLTSENLERGYFDCIRCGAKVVLASTEDLLFSPAIPVGN